MAQEEKSKRRTRIDTQARLNKMIDMMNRPQGATVKEICAELEINPKTFYRNLRKLDQIDVPYITKPAPNEPTSTVRYYILKSPVRGSNVFLTSSEKAILRMMLQSTEPLFAKYNSHQEEAKVLLDKLNDGIIHDVKNTEYKYIPEPFTVQQKWEYGENFYLLSQALDLKQSVSLQTSGRGGVKFEEEFISFEDKTFFQVYTIVNKQGIFYVYGKVVPFDLLPEGSKLPADIRCLKIRNLKNIKLQKQYVYSIPDDYDFDYWENFYFPKNEKITVHLAMNESTLHTVMHASQYYPKTLYDYGGKTHITVETSDLEALKKYVLGFGAGIQVIAPQNFADSVKYELEKMLEFYQPQKEPEFYKEMIQVHAPENTFDKHSWKTTTFVDLLFHWWPNAFGREGTIFHKVLNYSLFNFNEPGLRKVLDVEEDIYTFGSEYVKYFKLKSPKIEYPAKVIFYEDYVGCEFPFPDKIDGDIEFLYPALKNYSGRKVKEKNFSDMINKFTNMSDERKKILLEHVKAYSEHEIFALFTGIDYINPEWAKELSEKGTICGFRARALLFTSTGDTEGNIDIKVYKY